VFKERETAELLTYFG